MMDIPHWREPRRIRLAKSSSGVWVTTHPDDNLVRAGLEPWPTPELLQKYCASSRFRGATQDDDRLAREGLGLYCDLQSTNSEDAVTWSVFGNLAYLPEQQRTTIARRILDCAQVTTPRGPVRVWLWRRLPHPEKPQANNGPEIDFGFQANDLLLLGEAKWNSPLGSGQGVEGNRDQLDLRLLYCSKLGRAAAPHVRTFIVMGVAPEGDLLSAREGADASSIRNLRWREVVDCFEPPLRDELLDYLDWRSATISDRAEPGLDYPHNRIDQR